VLRRLAFVGLLAAVVAPAAHAAGPAFGIRPVGNWKLGYFVYAGKPGTALDGKIAISNNGNRAGTAKIFATDATTGQTSGTVYKTSGERPSGVGAWLRLSTLGVELGPKERRVVPFTVNVPAGVEPGQHVGGIVIETAQQTTGAKSKGKASVRVTVRNLAIVAVQVNVPGPRVAKFAIGKVTAGGRPKFQQVFVKITNAGNVMAKPKVTIAITDDKGKLVFGNRYQLDTVLPHTSIDYPMNVTKKALGVGKYHTVVSLLYATPGGGAAVVKATPTLAVTPRNVTQVFTSAAKPTPPPAAAGARPPASPAKRSGSGPSPLVIGVIVVGGLALLAAGWFAATSRARRNHPV
jgi:hypothetical protein